MFLTRLHNFWAERKRQSVDTHGHTDLEGPNLYPRFSLFQSEFLLLNTFHVQHCVSFRCTAVILMHLCIICCHVIVNVAIIIKLGNYSTILLTWCLGRPTMDGKTALGASSPAKPALQSPEPLSHTRAVLSSSSHILAGAASHCPTGTGRKPTQLSPSNRGP